MATVPDQSILDALRGYAIEISKHPTPRLIKIYISSTKHGEDLDNKFVQFHDSSNTFQCLEFKEERKVLLEVIGPELQSIYDDRNIEVKTNYELKFAYFNF